MIIQNGSNVVVSTSEVLNMLINSRMGVKNIRKATRSCVVFQHIMI